MENLVSLITNPNIFDGVTLPKGSFILQPGDTTVTVSFTFSEPITITDAVLTVSGTTADIDDDEWTIAFVTLANPVPIASEPMVIIIHYYLAFNNSLIPEVQVQALLR